MFRSGRVVQRQKVQQEPISSEEALIARIRQRDFRAFEQLYKA